jgi:hypothetical protein
MPDPNIPRDGGKPSWIPRLYWSHLLRSAERKLGVDPRSIHTVEEAKQRCREHARRENRKLLIYIAIGLPLGFICVIVLGTVLQAL